jgi:hypothetical protein
MILIVFAFISCSEESGGNPAEIPAPPAEEYDIEDITTENPNVTGDPVTDADSDDIIQAIGMIMFEAAYMTGEAMSEEIMPVEEQSEELTAAAVRVAYPIADISDTINYESGTVDFEASADLNLTGDFETIASEDGLSQFLIDEIGFTVEDEELNPPDGIPDINLNGVITLTMEETVTINDVMDDELLSGTTISGEESMTVAVGINLSNVVLEIDEENEENSTVSGSATVYIEMEYNAGISLSGDQAGYVVLELDAEGSATATTTEIFTLIMFVTMSEDVDKDSIFELLSQEPTYSIAGTATIYGPDGTTVVDTVTLDEDYIMSIIEAQTGESSSSDDIAPPIPAT